MLARIFLRFFAAVFVGAMLVVAAHYVVVGTAKAKEWSLVQWGSLVRAVTRVEIVKEYVHAEQVPLADLIEKVSREVGLPVIALQAVVEMESANGARLHRFEPAVHERFKKDPKMRDKPDLMMLASSHGPAHVMGFNAAPRCGVSWDKLYDSLIGLKCGARILRENFDRYENVKDLSRRLWLSFRDYNGSGEDAERYAEAAMSRVGSLLFAVYVRKELKL